MSSSDRAYYLTINLQFGGKDVVLSVPPVLMVLLMLLGMASYKVANLNAVSAYQQQKEQISTLQAEKKQLEDVLAHKEKERTQMATLADARSQELWGELEQRDREISRLWRIVNDTPAKGSARGQKPRRSLLGSRSSRHPNALAVKVDFNKLESQIEKREKEIEVLSTAAHQYRDKKMEEHRRELASRTPSIAPCSGEMTSGFGNRLHPVYGYGRFHGGCDFTADHGTPIKATAAGTVIHSDWLGGYGKVVEIDHGNGLKTLYAHCSELLVQKGAKLKKGDLIAKVGTTGLSSGPHCHYEIRQGEERVDPMNYLQDAGLPKLATTEAKSAN